MADLKWAVAYRFDDEADGYVLTTFDQETNQEWGHFGEQAALSTKDSLSDSDELEDDPS